MVEAVVMYLVVNINISPRSSAHVSLAPVRATIVSLEWELVIHLKRENVFSGLRCKGLPLQVS